MQVGAVLVEELYHGVCLDYLEAVAICERLRLRYQEPEAFIFIVVLDLNKNLEDGKECSQQVLCVELQR